MRSNPYGPCQKSAPKIVGALLTKMRQRLCEPDLSAGRRQACMSLIANLSEQMSDFMDQDSRLNQDCLAYSMDQCGLFLEVTDTLLFNA